MTNLILTCSWERRRGLAAVIACLLCMSGCGDLGGFVAHGLAGGSKAVIIEAQYRGLAGHSVAVLVAADERVVLYEPAIPDQIAEALAGQLAAHVPDARVLPAKQMAAFTTGRPDWPVTPYRRLLDELGVERLLIVEILEYRLHEPGNVNVWQGVATAAVQVIEHDSADPNNPQFAAMVTAQFPPGGRFGLVDAEAGAIRTGLNLILAREIGRLFHDYQVETK